jgi:hypothetical protein
VSALLAYTAGGDGEDPPLLRLVVGGEDGGVTVCDPRAKAVVRTLSALAGEIHRDGSRTL